MLAKVHFMGVLWGTRFGQAMLRSLKKFQKYVPHEDAQEEKILERSMLGNVVRGIEAWISGKSLGRARETWPPLEGS